MFVENLLIENYSFERIPNQASEAPVNIKGLFFRAYVLLCGYRTFE